MVVRLSLRVTISALSATFVAVVAVLTLGITMSTSLAALRDLADKHAVALVHAVQLIAQEEFLVPLTQLQVMANYTRSTSTLPLPLVDLTSGNVTNLDDYFAALRQGFVAASLVATGIVGVSAHFNTGSSIEFISSTHGGSLYASRVTDGIAAHQQLQLFQKSDHIAVALGSTPAAIAAEQSTPCLQPSAGTSAATRVALRRMLFELTRNATTPTINADAVSTQADGTLASTLFAVAPLFASGGALIGYVSASIHADALRFSFPAARDRGVVRYGAILDESGRILATDGFADSNASSAIAAVRTGPTATGTMLCNLARPVDLSSVDGATTGQPQYVCRQHVSASPHAILRAVSTAWLAGVRVGQFRTARIDVDGDSHHVAATRTECVFSGVKLVIVEILPESTVVGDVIQGRNIAIAVTVVVFVLVALVSFTLISLLLRPLNRIADRMTRAANLADEDEQDDVSAMAEVAELQLAYYAMNDELKRIRSFLPQAILQSRGMGGATTMAADDDDEEEMSALITITRGANSPAGGSPVATDDEGGPKAGDEFFADNASSNGSGGAGGRAGPWASAAMASLQCYVERSIVTIVVCNLVGFHGAVSRAASTTAVVGASAALVEVVTREIGARRGVLLSFHGDHFVATFNAARRCRDHICAGAASALALAAALPTPECFNLPVRLGVATGTCLVGNLGSETTKSFSTVGPAYAQATLLERLTRLYGPGCHILANRRTALACSTVAQPVFIDIVELPSRTGCRPAPIAALMPIGANPFVNSSSATSSGDLHRASTTAHLLGSNSSLTPSPQPGSSPHDGCVNLGKQMRSPDEPAVVAVAAAVLPSSKEEGGATEPPAWVYEDAPPPPAAAAPAAAAAAGSMMTTLMSITARVELRNRVMLFLATGQVDQALRVLSVDANQVASLRRRRESATTGIGFDGSASTIQFAMSRLGGEGSESNLRDGVHDAAPEGSDAPLRRSPPAEQQQQLPLPVPPQGSSTDVTSVASDTAATATPVIDLQSSPDVAAAFLAVLCARVASHQIELIPPPQTECDNDFDEFSEDAPCSKVTTDVTNDTGDFAESVPSTMAAAYAASPSAEAAAPRPPAAVGIVDVLPNLLLQSSITDECAASSLGEFYDRAFGRLSAAAGNGRPPAPFPTAAVAGAGSAGPAQMPVRAAGPAGE